MEQEEDNQAQMTPRPAWQRWAAGAGLVIFILLVVYQYLCILRGGL